MSKRNKQDSKDKQIVGQDQTPDEPSKDKAVLTEKELEELRKKFTKTVGTSNPDLTLRRRAKERTREKRRFR